jgi:hypothetical protein
MRKWYNQICGITHTRLRPGKNRYGLSYCVFLKCKHGFYRSVLIEWIKSCPLEKTTCPLCRQEFESFIITLK